MPKFREINFEIHRVKLWDFLKRKINIYEKIMDGIKNGRANKFDVCLKTSSPKYLLACWQCVVHMYVYVCMRLCIGISIHN